MNFHNVGFSFTWHHVVRYVENGTELPTPGAKWRKNVSAIRFTIGSDDGLSPACRQAIIWANNALSWITPRGTHFNNILSYIDMFSFTKIPYKGRLQNVGYFVSVSVDWYSY